MTRPFDAISWMWSEALAALESAERQRGRYFGLIGSSTAPKWEPPADVYETPEGLIVLVALPGVAANEVTLFIDSKGVIVQTERAPFAAHRCVHIHRMEIPHGAFERHIELPAGRYTLQSQAMVDGCLELHLTRD